MAAFDYVIVLLSFVFALAMTHLLSRAGELMLARQRVRFSGLQALMMLVALTQVYLNWLTIWDARSVKAWDLLSVTILFVFAVGAYFVCVAAAPTVAEDGAIDLEAFYWRNRRLFWGLFTAGVALGMATNFMFLKTTTPGLFLETNLASLPFFLPCLLALFVSSRWAQWTACIAAMAIMVGWMVLFAGNL
jgi:hypothetical protein